MSRREPPGAASPPLSSLVHGNSLLRFASKGINVTPDVALPSSPLEETLFLCDGENMTSTSHRRC